MFLGFFVEKKESRRREVEEAALFSVKCFYKYLSFRKFFFCHFVTYTCKEQWVGYIRGL